MPRPRWQSSTTPKTATTPSRPKDITIISVLERRSEIGLRRALGATKGQIRTQFLGESILLAVSAVSAVSAVGVLA